ncbi:hypothetical protein CLF_105675 [Clonorchis sinensis]|uniref:Uncharacterized protein n=1 Tax=Clonorchis sinensis TaxID=79923 RepID=G7YDY8_CLOSI|nr:hypothetical protein CLF_105675 [Clonorchis sinensis]
MVGYRNDCILSELSELGDTSGGQMTNMLCKSLARIIALLNVHVSVLTGLQMAHIYCFFVGYSTNKHYNLNLGPTYKSWSIAQRILAGAENQEICTLWFTGMAPKRRRCFYGKRNCLVAVPGICEQPCTDQRLAIDPKSHGHHSLKHHQHHNTQMVCTQSVQPEVLRTAVQPDYRLVESTLKRSYLRTRIGNKTPYPTGARTPENPHE